MKNQSPAPEVSIAEAATAVDAGAPLVDVREADEFAAVHVPQARSIPLSELSDRFAEVERDRTVYVICAAGGRSLAAATAMRDLGIDAVSVAGGTNGWIMEGRPVV